jgi:hypothetical protein
MIRKAGALVVAFVLGCLSSWSVFAKAGDLAHGPAQLMVVEKELQLSVGVETATPPLTSCPGVPIVRLGPGTVVSVRKDGPISWIELHASLVGNRFPLAVYNSETKPSVLDCATW